MHNIEHCKDEFLSTYNTIFYDDYFLHSLEASLLMRYKVRKEIDLSLYLFEHYKEIIYPHYKDEKWFKEKIDNVERFKQCMKSRERHYNFTLFGWEICFTVNTYKICKIFQLNKYE